MRDIFTSARSWLPTALQVLPYKDNHGDEEQFCDDDDDDDSDERDRDRDDDFISWWFNNVVMLIKVMTRNSHDCNDDAKDSSVDK